MTVTEKNVQVTKPWLERACLKEELIFCMFTIKKSSEVQMYRTEEISKEDLIKQLRHIADHLENHKIIPLG